MNRRGLLAGLTLLGGCSVLPKVPYEPRRDWPLTAHRASALPPRSRGLVLLVRTMSAAPGLDRRGLQRLLPDGSVHVDFYEQWSVPPAQAVETALRQWLAESGLFAAVVGPGSRLRADLVLESELTTLIADPQHHLAEAAIALVLIDRRAGRDAVLLQRTISADVPLTNQTPPALVAGLRSAVGAVLQQAEQIIAQVPLLRRR